MTSKPDYVSTLRHHWTDHTGRPLEPQVHWDATGTTPADDSIRWCPSGDPVLICIIVTHWKTTGKPLEDHWKHTGYQQFIFQWHASVHYGLISRHTGLPLEDHWLRVRVSSVMGPSLYSPFLIIPLRNRKLQQSFVSLSFILIHRKN